ncbi:YeiH family putative sulfate export transporter [Mobilitalea sibirica]|uniref:YeiH family putative sulfate export transporter n=1 Tax=Mobilitalea sibirica TaxID=1462919 RepID=A0A8J7H2V8_9FIRM|nr:YeiH family protein [Mobilitalea sibirica]MBH1941177.1 YeiH family putative sulfate export transporter [Mobilitalea sibirica]
MSQVKNYISGIMVAFILAVVAKFLSKLIPYHVISAGVFAMLIGMAIHPILGKITDVKTGINFVSKKVLKVSIVLMGASLSFTQVYEVGRYSLIVMTFTLLTAFGFGNLFGKLFHMNWKLSNLISAGTGICGGSAIAAISPTIEADDNDVAYAISATFIFDIIMVILFPLMGQLLSMSDLGFGLWTGTAVNDTSSVVAAGYAYSDIAGNYAVIVKLTRTLSIVPVVLIFSYVNLRVKINNKKYGERVKVKVKKIFPWFILLFLGMVALKSTGMIKEVVGKELADLSKFLMIMSLGAIGLKTDFKKVYKSGIMPMLHGFLISTLVVIVSYLVQNMLGQI